MMHGGSMSPAEYKQKFKKFATVLNKKHLDLLQKISLSWLDECQKQVPVVSGALKSSIKHRKTNRGVIVTYAAPYAYGVHEGKHARLQGLWKSSIPKHKRKTPSGKIVWVRAHTKQYKEGYKPIKGTTTSGKGMGWYAKDIHKETSGSQWMRDAYQTVLKSVAKEDRQLLPKTIKIELGK